MQKISWADIFALDDKSTITDAINVINQLKQVYEGMIQSIQNSNAQVSSSINDLKAQCDTLSKSVSGIGTNFEGNKTVILEAASQSQKLVDQYGALTKVQNDNAISLTSLTQTYNTLSDTQDNIKKKIVDQTGSINDLKNKVDEATKSYKSLGDATDQATKDKQLQNVKDLNTQYLTLNKALQDTKKAADTATGSYNSLQQQVTAAAKELKAMEGGIDAQGSKFKQLQTFVKEGNDKLKEFDGALGVGGRNVGLYKEQIEQLLPGIKGLSPELAEATEGAIGFGSKIAEAFTSTVGIIGAGIAAATIGISQYFERTVEGEVQLEETTSVFGALWNQTMTGAARIGGLFFGAAIDGFTKMIALSNDSAFHALILAQQQDEIDKKRIKNIAYNSEFELAANKLLVESRNALEKTEQERLSAALLADKLLTSQHARNIELLSDQQKLNEQKIIASKNGDALTKEEEEQIANELANVKKTEAEYEASGRRRKALITSLTTEIDKERTDEIAREKSDKAKLDQSRIQQDVDTNNRILANLKSTEEQRKQAIEKNYSDERKIAQLARDQAIADAAKQSQDRSRKQLGVSNYNDRSDQSKEQMLADDKSFQLEKQKIEQDYANKEITLATTRDKSLLDNYNKYAAMRIDSSLKIHTAELETEKAISQSTIEFNQRILNNEDTSYEERNRAIKTIGEEKIKILGNDSDRAIAIAEAETKKKILTDGLEVQHNAELSAQRTALLQKYQSDVEKVNTETIKAVKENVFTTLNRDLANLANKTTSGKSQALDQLAAQYQAGNLTIAQYETQRQKIIRQSEIQQAKDALDMYQKILENTNLSEKQRTDIEAKAAVAREKITSLEVDYTIKKKKDVNKALMDLGNAALTFAKSISQRTLDDALEKNQEELNALAAQRDAKLAIVGNDAAAQARINADFNKKQLALQKEANAAKRKDAIFQKEVDSVKIIVDTAVGVAGALAQENIPLAFIIGALGAIELATVLSQKIPSYAKGTESAQEGWSLVGEARREIRYSKGRVTMYDKPTLAYLDQGDKIFNNPQTEGIMESLGTIEDVRAAFGSLNYHNNKREMIEAAKGSKEVVNAINETSRRMINAMEKGTQDVWDERGYHRYQTEKNARIARLDKRYTLGG